jgi:outer membrane protein TolC
MRRCLILLFLIVFCTATGAQNNDLNYYLSKALQNSPLLKDLRSMIEMNKIDSLRIKAESGPMLTAISNDSYAPVIKGRGFDQAITNGSNISALLSFSKEITGRNNRQNRYDALSILSRSVSNTEKISEQELKKSISAQYVTAYGDYQQYHFNNDVLGILYNEQKLLKELTEKGVYRQTDYLSFVITLQQQEMAVDRCKSQYRNDFAILNYLSGIEDTSFIELPDPELVPETIPGFSGSVYYKQFYIDSLKIANAREKIGFSYKPKISLIADGGYLSSLTFRPERNFGVDAGVSVTIPIFDGRQRGMQYNKLSIQEQTRKNYLDFYNTQYNQELRRLYQQLAACRKLKGQIGNQISYTKALMDASHKLLETGDIRVDEYIMSISLYLNANNQRVENTISEYFIINDINYWNRAN